MKLRLLLSSFALTALTAGTASADNPFLDNDYWETATVEQVQADMAAGHSLLEETEIGRQALHYSLRGYASLDVVRFLLEQGVPYRPEGGRGVWAELYAARYGDLELIELFEEFGADFQIADYMGETPAYWLTKNKVFRPELVDHFEDIGLDFDAPNRLGVTPLGAVALNRRGAELFDYLAERSYDDGYIDSQGRDLFMRALTANDNPEMLDRFYEMSEDPEAPDNYGLSGVLLTVADEGTSEERLAFLEDHGFDLTITNARGQSALHMLLANKEDEAEGLEALLARGFDVNAADDAGNTPLLLALARKDPAVIETLLDAGADPLAANDRGVTPLMAALTRGAEFGPVIDRLLEGGADLAGTDAAGGNALIYAVRGGQPVGRLAQILAAGVDANAVDQDGMTALMYAALDGEDPAVIELLLASGADAGVRDIFDDTAALMAAENPALAGNPVLAQLQ